MATAGTTTPSSSSSSSLPIFFPSQQCVYLYLYLYLYLCVFAYLLPISAMCVFRKFLLLFDFNISFYIIKHLLKS